MATKTINAPKTPQAYVARARISRRIRAATPIRKTAPASFAQNLKPSPLSSVVAIRRSIAFPRPRVHGPRKSGVAYDEKLAGRIRDLIAGEPGLTEQKMFGGL